MAPKSRRSLKRAASNVDEVTGVQNLALDEFNKLYEKVKEGEIKFEDSAPSPLLVPALLCFEI